jgi:tellurite resistance protein
MKHTRAGMIARFAIVSLPLIAIGGTRATTGAAQSANQHPLLDKVANKVIEKYQTSSCQQLAQQKSEPPSPEKVKAVQFLKTDPQLRTAFINKIAGPIANKLFDCGFIP